MPGKAGDQLLQQFQRLHVEIVGRLVEHQQIGRPRQHARQDQPRPLAAGQLADRRARLFGLEQEILHVGDDVALLAVDDDRLAAPVGQEMRQRFLRIDGGALLVERGDLEIAAEPHRACVGLRARRSASSGASSCRRRSGRRGRPVAALDAGREVPDHGQVAETLRDALASITSLPDSAASLAAIVGQALGAAMAAEAAAHRLQFAQPPHVALAPRGDAVAQPVLLAHDLAAELVLLALLLLEDRVAPFLEMREALVQPPRPAAVEPDRRAATRARGSAGRAR